MARCWLCNDLEKKDEDDVRLGFDFTPVELIRSVGEQGCASCTVILVGLRNAIGHNYLIEQDVRRVYARCRSMRNRKPTTLTLEVYFEKEYPKLELEFFSLQDEAWKAIMPRTCMSGHPLSPEALAWVRSLLDTCISNHTMCRNYVMPRLPKRVLAISPSIWKGVEVKLIENHDISAPYAAFSHCWGNHRTYVTTRATLDDHKNGIEWHRIPKTFQEAIRFSLQLNIRYIWIDSLCIVQDDATDWEVESSKMADIYQHSYLTLAATASAGDSQGCFSDAFNTTHKAVSHLPPEYTNQCPVAVRAPLTHWDTLLPSRLAYDYPLLARAWVFQERILSPRTVHFCGSEIVWECRETCACECGSLGGSTTPGGEFHQVLGRAESGNDNSTADVFPDLINPLKSLVDKQESEVSIHSSDPGSWLLLEQSQERLEKLQWLQSRFETTIQALKQEKEPPELSRQWRKLVEQYSALRITRPTDRLPALAGLCDRTKRLRGDYLAGLWADSIWLDLLWKVDMLQAGQRHTQRSQHQRPTWSWISVEGPVSYWDDIKCLSLGPLSYYSNEDRNITALAVRELRRQPLQLDFDVQHAGRNPFGEVSSAVLMIKSYSRTAILRPRDDQQVDDANIPVKYNVYVEGVSIPFFADYAFNIAQSTSHNRQVVTLLLIHPQIGLVLRPSKWDPKIYQSLSQSFRERLYTYAGSDPSRSGVWERIGISRVSDTLLDLYRLDWMKGAEVSTFCIV
ncbi:heterokaryon incompatibility protein-domain-containing protein [Lophiotrema nucula]|uniref:Heterokaryon incompatibility protein-domain-containing protein n=1 Tax=Lophiotrema nucula TaxID=690887 RepID=A0A6A5ZUJ3_9PLEO|nr:heterokaryon incompatibility protein-domain-containing protein [Lophiotrema nucula]